MTGQITTLPLELVGVVVAASMVAGAVDIVRQPGWAWQRAGESKAAYLILDLLLPVIGLSVYAFRARPKVTAETTAGPGPATTTDPEPATAVVEATARVEPAGPVPTTVPDRFTGFQEMAGNGHPGPWETEVAHDEPEPFEISSTFFSTGVASRTVRHPLALARAYRPKQRTSLPGTEADMRPEPPAAAVAPPEPQAEAVAPPEPQAAEPVRALVPEASVVADPTSEPEPETVPAPLAGSAPDRPELVVVAAPTVPSGWKVDPTGRHQFRYWNGSQWTENVADDGDESRDAVCA